MGLISWFKSLFRSIGAFVSRMWSLARPFLQEALSATALNVWVSCKELFVEAAEYVENQGLPTSSDKRDAFKAYMKERAAAEIGQLRESEYNLLLEMAVAIMNKIKGS